MIHNAIIENQNNKTFIEEVTQDVIKFILENLYKEQNTIQILLNKTN